MDRERLRDELTDRAGQRVVDSDYGWTAYDVADFALEVLAERDAEIADDIIQLHQNHKTNELFLRELSYFVHELKGGNATAHAMFDEMQEALGK